MHCPQGKIYWPEGKLCIRPEALPGAKGKSLSPCPPGKVWLKGARKCVSNNVYEKHYGKNKLVLTLKRQKRIGQKTRKQSPIKPKAITPKKVKPHVVLHAVSPAITKISSLNVGKPRKDSYMPPGLKTKKNMIKWISDKCTNQSDSISLEPFSEMDSTQLKTIVRLGNDYCYLADDLDKHIRTSIENDVALKDITYPGYRIDSADLGAIQYQGLRLDNKYKLPSKLTEIPASHYKLYIDTVDNSPFKYIFLYDERKVKKVGSALNYSPAIPNGGFLGYIPENGTNELVQLIKTAYLKGRLFTKVTRPFGCCRFHLKKTKDYWKDNTKRKIDSMIEEIKLIL